MHMLWRPEPSPERRGGNPIDILQLLDELEEVISAGWPVPGVGRAMVDVDKATEILASIREHLPTEMQYAREVMAERETLMQQTHDEAQRLIEEARRQAEDLVQEEVLYKKAERQAREMLQQAAERAEEIRARADDYTLDSLRQLEARLTQTIATVQNGIASLQRQAPQDD